MGGVEEAVEDGGVEGGEGDGEVEEAESADAGVGEDGPGAIALEGGGEAVSLWCAGLGFVEGGKFGGGVLF